MRLHTLIEGKPRAFEVTARFDRTYDAVVVGLGTAGATALIGLARQGVRALGVERATGMGGQGGLGCVWDYFYGLRGGLQEEISRECGRMMATGRYTTTQRPGLPEQSFPGLARTQVMERMALDAGADVLYETQATGVYLEGNQVAGVRLAGPEGMLDAACRILIDGTGEADAAVLAGCELLPNRLSDGATQYYSLASSRLIDGEYTIGGWSTRAHIDCGDAAALTGKALEILSIPQDADSADNRVVYLSPMLGNREGRRVRGREALRLSELLSGQKTAQPLFYAHAPIDSFNRDLALEDEVIQDFRAICDLGNVLLSVGVPMGALLPEHVEGMLVVGRCLSVDHDLAACVRMMRDMQKSGEAAAVMAHEALRTGLRLSELPYEPVRDRLRKSGCLDEAQDLPWTEGCRWSHHERDGMAIVWPQDEEEMHELLSRPFPSGGLWLCRQEPERWREPLLKWLCEDNGVLRRHCALALGLQRHPAALPALREMALRGGNDRLGCGECWKAVCLLGRYALAEDVPLLREILERPLPQATCPEDTPLADQAALLFLQAEASLVRILRANPGHSADWAFLRQRVLDPSFRLALSVGQLDLTPAARELCV